MYPPSIVLKDELGEAYLPRLLHLLDELEQAAVVRSIPSNDISSTAKDMVTILHTPDERVELLAAVARKTLSPLTRACGR